MRKRGVTMAFVEWIEHGRYHGANYPIDSVTGVIDALRKRRISGAIHSVAVDDVEIALEEKEQDDERVSAERRV